MIKKGRRGRSSSTSYLFGKPENVSPMATAAHAAASKALFPQPGVLEISPFCSPETSLSKQSCCLALSSLGSRPALSKRLSHKKAKRKSKKRKKRSRKFFVVVPSHALEFLLLGTRSQDSVTSSHSLPRHSPTACQFSRRKLALGEQV